MQIEVSDLANGTCRVTLRGRLDSRAVDAVEAPFMAAVTAAGRRSIVDLGGVEFIASMGIRMLVSGARAASARGARLALYGARGPVREVFDYAGLAGVVPIADDEAAALGLVEA